jgi:drug/metabolite transporter (DMT)-like permease
MGENLGHLKGEVLPCDIQDLYCLKFAHHHYEDCPFFTTTTTTTSTTTTTTTEFSVEEQANWKTEKHIWSVTRSRIGMQFIVPVCALAFGTIMSSVENNHVLGKLFLFSGAETLMGLYMKMVFSKFIVSEEGHMQGFPAAFLVTGLQQITSFVLLMILILLSQVTPWSYSPKALTTRKEYGMLVAFSLCFALNIALNNLSLTMLDVSTNQIIRSFAPLATLLVQCVFSKITDTDVKPTWLSFMLVGSIFGIVAVIAKGMSMSSIGADISDTYRLIFGVAICLVSLFFASMEPLLGSIHGGSLKLNPIDTVVYLAVPSTLFLIIPASFVPNSVNWPSYTAPMTDLAIAREVIRLSPMTFFLAALSGALALSYNLVYTVVQKLSASTVAFASTFNKFSTISLALIFGFELLPPQRAPQRELTIMMLLCIAGNLGAFAASTWHFSLPANSFSLQGYRHRQGWRQVRSEAGETTPAKVSKRPISISM